MHQIVRLSEALRAKGVPASIRSTQTACEIFELLEAEDSYLKEALASVYVKDKQHQENFNKAYDEIFADGEKIEILVDGKDSTSGKKKTKDSKDGTELKPSDSLNFNQNLKIEQKDIKTDEINYNPPIEDYMELSLDEISLMDRDINFLDFFEPELFELCQKLGRKIANRRSKRYKRSKMMRPDMRKTIRKNMKYGGTLLDIVKRKPHIKKNQHIFLSDVSGSCDWISNWFFCVVYAAQKSFYRSRFFDFDNKMVETTSALQEKDLMEAFVSVRDIRQKNIMIHGTSNMYLAFESFLNKVTFNYRSSIVILSDCRDWAGPKENRKPLSANLVQEMVNRSKRVIIMNPEPKIKWDVVDSCVSDYVNAGAEVKEVRNLRQLADLIESL